MRKRLLVAVGAVAVPLLAIAGFAMAGGESSLAEARNATAPFHDLATARAAGYTVELHDTSDQACIADLGTPSAGAMGVHMVNMGLLDDPTTATPFDDTTLDPTRPEALVYERRNNGTLKLVALEYVVFQAAWKSVHGANAGPPTLFGVPFDSNTGARFNLPPFYALHAWVWKPNPTDMFFAWNPKVSCN